MDRRQRIGSRTPLACDECRRSKTKCSGTRPLCRRCTRRKTACTWPASVQPLPGTPESIQSPSLDASLSEIYPESLLDIFYTRHHDVEFCGFLHRPTFMAELHSQSPFLAAAIASLASVYDSDERDYTEQATALGRAVSDQPSVYNIQGFLVLAVRQLIAWRDRTAWMHAGTAIRMAHALQLDRESVRRNDTNRQREVRRRTFWACFVVDRLISYACHHRFSVSDSPTPSLPCSDNAFAFGEADTGPSLSGILTPLTANTLSNTGIAPFYIAAVKLWGDMAVLHVTGGRRTMAQPPTDAASPFFQASQALDTFIDNLPPALHWSCENYFLFKSLSSEKAAAFVNFNFVLHHARCVMHHEYLPQLDMQYYAGDLEEMDAAGLPPSYSNKPIIDTCIHAINTITEIADVADDIQSTVAGSALMTAAAVHLWIVYTQTCDRCPKHVARAHFESLLQKLESWESEWPLAAAWAQTLGMLYKLYEFSYGTEPVAEFLLWESEDFEEGEKEDTGNCLHDKVRGILAHPLHPPDVKRRNLRVFSQALWANLWGSSLVDFFI